MILTRRSLSRGTLASLAVAYLSRAARGQNGSLFPFPGDNGRQYYNYRLPSEPSFADVPGVVWTGAGQPDAILVEYFDYNCPFCREAAPDIDALLRARPGLRLGLVNDPVLSPGSVEAAKVQQAVLRAAGPAQAYACHRTVLARRGPIAGAAAIAVAAELGLDRKAIARAADLPQIGAVVSRQAHLADALGLTATPSFQIGNVGIVGYPGARAMARGLANMTACGKLTCG